MYNHSITASGSKLITSGLGIYKFGSDLYTLARKFTMIRCFGVTLDTFIGESVNLYSCVMINMDERG